jgi:hypothetical protein
MKVTGNKLYELLQLWQSRKNSLVTEFEDSLMVFADQDKRSPEKIDEEIIEAEVAIVTIQLAQKQFNQTVKVSSGEPLDSAIKRLGVLKRAMQRWESVMESTTAGRSILERSKDSDFAKPSILPSLMKKKLEVYTKSVLQLRAEIGDANATSMDLDIPDKLRE